MREAIKVDQNGLYTDVTLVDDAFTGVVPFYADPEEPVLSLDTNNTDDPEQEEETEPEIAGYIVGVPVPQGLFHPRFDLVAWEEGETSGQSSYWIEGLTPEEIEELTKPKPQEPSELERLQTELTNTQVALTDTYEQLLAAQEETTSTQVALTDVYEQLLNVQEELISIKGAAE
ncbi:hypothetical protein D3C74_216110 [compost metagenome]